MRVKTAVIMTTPIRLRARPFWIIVFTVNFSEPNTMALGAVATGSIKAQLALTAAGAITSSGSIFIFNAATASMGISKVVVAVLLVTSVKKVTARQMSEITIMKFQEIQLVTNSPGIH